MYDLIYSLVGHSYVQGDSIQQYILYICGAVIVLLTGVFIDIMYNLIKRFLK